jgi:hypothetical protein
MTITDTQKASPSDTQPKIRTGAFGRHSTAIGLLSIWFTASLAANLAGLFRTAPGDVPLALIFSVSAPPLLFLAAYNAVTSVRRYADSLDLRLLTALQGGRVIGFVFLALYAHGLLPGLFAWPAGLGDVLVGGAAPFVLLAQIQQDAGWEKRVWWLNFSGSVDFVVSVTTGLLTSQSAIGLITGPISSAAIDNIPVSLIPTFAVPFFIILHAISFIQLKNIRLQRKA